MSRLLLGHDYRMPHDLSEDYWLYERFAGLAAQHDETLLIGDSVVWGEYVKRDETLSHYLNELSGEDDMPISAWRVPILWPWLD